jgi:hypothetical protein
LLPDSYENSVKNKSHSHIHNVHPHKFQLIKSSITHAPNEKKHTCITN